MSGFLQTHVCQATLIFQVLKSFTIPAPIQRPVRYSTQSLQHKPKLSKVHTSQRARPVNNSAVGNIGYDREQHHLTTHLQPNNPTIEYPKVRPGDPPLRELVRSVFPKDQYEVGWIIRAPLHEEDYQSGADYPSKYISESKYSFVHTKQRIFIVLAKYHYHYLAIPLYTHNNKGLDGKSNQDEFVYVHDKYRVSRKPLEQRKNGHIDAVIDLQARTPLYRPKSAAHLNYIVARSYSLKVEYHGHLTKESVRKLMDIAKPHLTNMLTFKG